MSDVIPDSERALHVRTGAKHYAEDSPGTLRVFSSPVRLKRFVTYRLLGIVSQAALRLCRRAIDMHNLAVKDERGALCFPYKS